MARQHRPPQRRSQPSASARLQRTLLLPLPQRHAEELSLQYHTAFQALRMRQGCAHGLAILLQLVVLAGFIDEARRHEIRAEVLVAAERGINVALEHGKASGEWMLDAQTDELMATLIAWHDSQLRTTPLSVIRQALDRLERLRDGKSFNQLPPRR
ncbi:hypothetical protein [Burkholderia gladioli]|uniref:hypothetical protein n=1 Tax=Burkholderia gladioli TaxID=28095 RepID=UPI001641E2F5|nr:hypothetical protein [Burkholderia gladioli]